MAGKDKWKLDKLNGGWFMTRNYWEGTVLRKGFCGVECRRLNRWEKSKYWVCNKFR